MTDTTFRIRRPAGLHRLEFTAMLSMMMASTALATDIGLPAFGAMRDEFGLPADSTRVGATVTVFFLGLAFAQIMYGPLADRFGRKPTLYIGLGIYIAGSFAAAAAPTLELVILSRFLWGVGSAGPRVVSVSVVRDLFEGERMARAMSFIMAVFILVPVLAPSVGAAVLAFGSWRVVYLVVGLWALAIAAWTLRLPETLDPSHRVAFEWHAILRAVKRVVTTRSTIGYTMAMVFGFGAFVSYLSTSELIISEVYDKRSLFPFVFGATAGAMGSAMLANVWLVRRFGVAPLVRTATMLFVILSAGLSALAWLSGGVPPFAVFVVALGVTLGTYSLLLPNLNTLAMQPMGAIAGIAAAVIGTVSTTGGSVLGFFLDQAFDGTVRPLALGFLLYGSVALAFALWAERGTG